MVNFRNFIDITPWDNQGHSAFGLKRGQAKMIALVFITIGALLINPPFIPSPDDFINFYIAGYMEHHLNISYNSALLCTYTIIPWVLLLFGFWIYPYNTKSLMNGFMNKAKKFIIKTFKSPKRLAIGAVVFWVMYHVYKIYLFGGGK